MSACAGRGEEIGARDRYRTGREVWTPVAPPAPRKATEAARCRDALESVLAVAKKAQRSGPDHRWLLAECGRIAAEVLGC